MMSHRCHSGSSLLQPAFLALVLVLVAGPVLAATFVVNPDGTGDAPTIQAAIDLATDGDLIELTGGVFTGDGNRGIDFYGKSIHLRSASNDADAVIIDCEELDRGLNLVSGEGPGSIIESVTIRNGRALGLLTVQVGSGAGIRIIASSPTVSNCIVEDCEADARGAIYVESGNPLIQKCVVRNSSGAVGGGLAIQDASPRVEDSLFYGNRATDGAGIFTTGASAPEFLGCVLYDNLADVQGGGATIWGTNTSAFFGNCTIVGNRAVFIGGGLALGFSNVTVSNSIIAYSENGEGVACIQAGSYSFDCTDIFGNDDGDWVGCIADQNGENGNISEDPIFCGFDDDDFTLSMTSPCAPDNSDCGLIGALGVGCSDPTPVREASWGEVKWRFK